MTRAQMKMKARNDIRGNVGRLFLIGLIIGCLAITTVLPFFGLFFMSAFSLGTLRAYMALSKGESIRAGYAFRGFSSFWRSGWLMWLTGLFVYLWSLLLLVPGIIKTYSYAMAPYVLAEHPELTARQCLRYSKQMMRGHKFQLFVLELSFILWDLLVLVTLGIMAIWVGPYKQATKVNFYHNIKPAELRTDKFVARDETPEPSVSEPETPCASEAEACPTEEPTVNEEKVPETPVYPAEPPVSASYPGIPPASTPYPGNASPYPGAVPTPSVSPTAKPPVSPYPEGTPYASPYPGAVPPPPVYPAPNPPVSPYPGAVPPVSPRPVSSDHYGYEAQPNPYGYGSSPYENSRVIMPKTRKKPTSDTHTQSSFFNEGSDL